MMMTIKSLDSKKQKKYRKMKNKKLMIRNKTKQKIYKLKMLRVN